MGRVARMIIDTDVGVYDGQSRRVLHADVIEGVGTRVRIVLIEPADDRVDNEDLRCAGERQGGCIVAGVGVRHYTIDLAAVEALNRGVPDLDYSVSGRGYVTRVLHQ